MSINVSFIVPVYNVEKYLSDCLITIINQTNVSKEIILVNDGSTDNSLKICKNFTNKYDFIKIIDKKNGGLSSARNEGLKHAKGEYIYFIDSDDILIGNHTYDMYKICKKNNLDIIRAEYCLCTEDNQIVDKKILTHSYINKVLNGIQFLEAESKYNSYEVTAWSGMFKTDYLIKNKIFFRENVTHEDHEYFLKCLLTNKNNRVLKINTQTYGYRVRPGSITKTPSLKNIRDILYNINNMDVFIDNLNLSKGQKSIAYKTVSALFYQLTSVYCRLLEEDKLIASTLIPTDRKFRNKVILYSFNIHQKLKIILFLYARNLMDFIYIKKQKILKYKGE